MTAGGESDSSSLTCCAEVGDYRFSLSLSHGLKDSCCGRVGLSKEARQLPVPTMRLTIGFDSLSLSLMDFWSCCGFLFLVLVMLWCFHRAISILLRDFFSKIIIIIIFWTET